jgi:AcrR family transcriptional regulator
MAIEEQDKNYSESSRAIDSKKRLLNAATSEFAQKGLDGARIDVIADVAGINKRMIYHYFGGKETLYLEVLRYNFNQIYDITKVAMVPDTGPMKKIESFLRKYFIFLSENNDFVRLLDWETLNGGRFASQFLPQLYDLVQPELSEILREGQSSGLFRQELDLRHMIVSVNALCQVYFSRSVIIRSLWQKDIMSEEMLEERIKHVLDLLFNGILN